MILSDVNIRNEIASGQIAITPFDANRLNPASYTLSLGSNLLIPRSQEIVDAFSPQIEYDEIEIGKDGYVVRPGEFLLGSVAEELTVSTAYCARLDARTSLARLGLNVLQGSTHIEPGQHGSHETLEINNVGPSPVRLYLGMKIVKVLFAQLQDPASSGYTGSYMSQKDPRITT